MLCLVLLLCGLVWLLLRVLCVIGSLFVLFSLLVSVLCVLCCVDVVSTFVLFGVG